MEWWPLRWSRGLLFLQTINEAQKEKNMVETVLPIVAWCVECIDDDLRNAVLWMPNDMMELSATEEEGANERGRCTSWQRKELFVTGSKKAYILAIKKSSLSSSKLVINLDWYCHQAIIGWMSSNLINDDALETVEKSRKKKILPIQVPSNRINFPPIRCLHLLVPFWLLKQNGRLRVEASGSSQGRCY